MPPTPAPLTFNVADPPGQTVVLDTPLKAGSGFTVTVISCAPGQLPVVDVGVTV